MKYCISLRACHVTINEHQREQHIRLTSPENLKKIF